jgi:spore germination protein GerM
VEVTLFFLRADGEALAPETRQIFRTATVNDRARQVLQALFGGSESGLLPAIPEGTTLREFYLGADGTAYVDLSPEFQSGLSTGSDDAITAVYAVVNTLTKNFDEIQKVKILVDGDEVDDLGGHISLSHPILPEMSLVKASGSTGQPARSGASRPSGSQPTADPNQPSDPNASRQSDPNSPAANQPPFQS